jgi:chromosome segregation ATPase
VVSKDFGLIGTFIEACMERMELWNDLEGLENDLQSRRIRRKDFNRRRRIIIQRLTTLKREATILENKVSKIGKKYSPLINKQLKAQGEVRTLHSESYVLLNQLRSGKLSTKAYRSLRDANRKRLRKAKAAIEEVITELKDLMK